MTARLGVLVAHGMGNQKEDFAEPFLARMREELASEWGMVAFEPVHWAPVLAPRQQWYWEGTRDTTTAARTIWRGARKFVVNYFGDATVYQTRARAEDSAYKRVHNVVHSAVTRLEARVEPGAPLVLVAHSLGCLMLSNHVWDRQNWRGPQPDPHGATPFQRMETLLGLVTFGCNLPLFCLGHEPITPISLPGPGVPATLRRLAKWQNLYSAHDPLGWPLVPLYGRHLPQLDPAAAATVACIEDVAVSAGSFPANLTPLSHNAYWTDADLIGRLVEYLLAALGETFA